MLQIEGSIDMAKKAARKPTSFADELRQAIRDSGMTHYAIANETGFRARVKGAMTPDMVDRFMNGRDLRLSTVEKIVGAIGMRLAMVEG